MVNNAGAAHHGPFTETTARDALTAIRLDCEAAVTLARAFLAQARPGDALINVSSTLVYAPPPGLAVYSASKAFVTVPLRRPLARATAVRRIRDGSLPRYDRHGLPIPEPRGRHGGSDPDTRGAGCRRSGPSTAAPAPPWSPVGRVPSSPSPPACCPADRPRAAKPPALIRPARPLRPPERPGKTVQQIADIPERLGSLATPSSTNTWQWSCRGRTRYR
ncbi:SDR family NAD(P)-dependent oxidoreductase [Streptomyces sp. NPDC056402]|uniref:SDR family NAD(P)-dependent oxidoreductase n=1 Tax=Streptomyces sp. NPDC056402 TaxID=3345810 RepID=UPI0035E19BE9